MNTRFTGNTMKLEHFHDFYMLEALSAAISMEYSNNPDNQFKHSLNRLESDVKEAFAHLTHEMAFRIYVYLWAAALGEARYAKGHNLKYWITNISNGQSRQTVYGLALDFFPCKENVEILKGVFSQKWGSAYGGKAWLNIVEAMDMYGKVSDATFIDHAVDLEHNGGCVFSKTANFGLNCFDGIGASELKAFLDFKFKGNLLESPVENYGSWQKTAVSGKVYRLVERYINVCTKIGTGKYVRSLIALEYMKPTLEWLDGYTVDWDCQILSTAGKLEEKVVAKMTGKKVAKTVKTGKTTGKHVDEIRVGHTYYVEYDGRSHDCGFVADCMVNRGYIRIERIGYHGFGKPRSGFWYAKQWLFETKEDANKEQKEIDLSADYEDTHVERIEIGKTYLVKFNGEYDRNCSWIDGPMDKYNGKEITVSELGVKHSTGRNGYGAGTGWWFSPKWLYAKKELGKYVTVKSNAEDIFNNWNEDEYSITWLSGMSKMIGKKCITTQSSGNTVYVTCPATDQEFYMQKEWLEPYETLRREREEREERRERRHEGEVMCYGCDGWISEDDSFFSEVAMETYCSDCYSEKFGTCDHCGQEEWADELVETPNHPKYYKLCDTCANDLGDTCYDCEEWYPNDEMCITEDGYSLCDDCASGKVCRKCGNMYYDMAHHMNTHRERREGGAPVVVSAPSKDNLNKGE